MALSGTDYLELLPVAWRRITPEGIRLGYLTYDSAALNPYRGQPSPFTTKSGRREVHHDPYDLTQVWLRPDPDGQWLAIPWVHHGQVNAPFADFTLRHVRHQLAVRGQDQDQSEIAAALDALLDHAGTPPTDRTARRVLARTRAAAASSRRDEPGTTTGKSEQPPAAPDEAAAEEEPLAQVIPFGIFDAHAEAERPW